MQRTRNRSQRYRPTLETLEDRLTPAAFVEPPVIASVGGVLTATLNMNAGNTVLDGNPVVNSWTYNGLYVGPTLVANPGDVLHITVNNNLPEGEITNPSTTAPFGVSNDVNQLGYGFTVEAVKLGGLPSPLLTLTFKTCQGAPAATAADFTCKVTDASDDLGNVVDPTTVTCAVTVP